MPWVLGRVPGDIDDLILVDGRSCDGTVAAIRRLRPDARLIQQSGRGKGNALACGFRICGGDIIVMLDGDGSTDPAEIPRFVAALHAGADFAKGSRFLAGGGSSDITWTRRVGNWGFCRLVNVLYGRAFSDLCYGYNAFWADCRHWFRLENEGFEVEALLTVQTVLAGLSVREVPSFESARAYGSSNLRPVRDGLRILRIIMSERFRRTGAAASPSDGGPPARFGRVGRSGTPPS